MSEAFALYHWSPVARRKQITRYGFRPSSRSVAGDWKPPYVCFSADPQLAWNLSGRFHPEVSDWDLWMVWSDDVETGWEIIPFDYIDWETTDKALVPKEYRIYERIWKRDVWLVATRTVGAP